MTAATDEAAFLRAIVANPGDDTPRLVLADWLEEHADDPCPHCGGGRPGEWMYALNDASDCETCHGSGRVPNGNAERAEFIRVQCDLVHTPMCAVPDSRLCTCPWHTLWRRERELWGYLPARTGVMHELKKSFREWAVILDSDNGSPGPRLAVVAVAAEWAVILDSDNGSGLTNAYPWLVVRRGFPAVARLTLAALLGGECSLCQNWGRDFHQWNQPGHPTCPACSGTGRVGGCAAELLAACPTLERVELADREPDPDVHTLPLWTWWEGSDAFCLVDETAVPTELFDLIPGTAIEDWGEYRKFHPTRAAALDALSTAALAYARTQAVARGLVPAGLW